MYGGILHKFKHSAPAAACDYTPAAVNWSNITYEYSNSLSRGTRQQITGITCNITLRVTFATTQMKLYYAVSSSSGLTFNPISGPPYSGYTQIATNGTFSVANNDYVYFVMDDVDNVEDSITVTVVNTSDGNATLDTFTMTGEF